MSGLRWIWRLTGVGLLGVFGSLLASVIFVRLRSARHTYSVETVPTRPVGLVLGAQVFPDGRPSPFLAARLDLAQTLLDAGKITAIIVSGDHQAPEYNEPAAMRTYLISRGVPAAVIVSDGGGLDTYDSCVRARRMFGVRSLTVITQSYHLPRAVATAREVGLDAVGVGDESVRAGSRSWRRGAVRDQVACVKTVLDLIARHDSSEGERSDAVRDALLD